MWVLIVWCFGLPGEGEPTTMATASFHSKAACVAAAKDLTNTKEVRMVGRCYEDPK